ncbi:MAG TPA: Na/Pi symporter [Candidatus Paceibacterota bacterium]
MTTAPSLLNTLVRTLALVTLYLFAIRKFTKQVEQLEGEHLRGALMRLTSTPTRGLLLGFIFSALVQSGSATIIALQSLVGVGLLTFASSVAIVLGANLGSRLSIQLIAWKLTYVAAYLMIAGVLIGRVKSHWSRYGKPIFYFGLTFLALSLISIAVAPLQSDTRVIDFLSGISSLPLAFLVGLVVTVLFQNSSVITSLAIVLATQGLFSFDQCIGLLLGAGLGSTSTVLFAALSAPLATRRVAISHVLFNALSLLLAVPILGSIFSIAQNLGGGVAQQSVNAYLIFSLASALVFFIFLKPFTALVNRLVR